MNGYSRERFEVLVVGGGPAAIAAAVCAAENGARVGMVDENANLGGQIWRAGLSDNGHAGDASSWYARLESTRVKLLCGHRVFHQPQGGVLLAEGADGVAELTYRNLVLATGARERFLPFAGWTLPNVMGAGGLQAMVKSGLPIRGKSVVLAGSGPLLLAVAASLKKRGADVRSIAEQAPAGRLARFGLGLWSEPGKLGQAI